MDPLGIPPLLKKYGEPLKFTAVGAPFLTYGYKKTGLAKADAERLLSITEELLSEMEKLLLKKDEAEKQV